MDTEVLNNWREIIKRSLTELADIPYPEGVDLQKKIAFDDQRAVYLVLVCGWQGVRRLHGCVAHLELIGDKIWIQEDGTEYGLATELVAAGIPPDHIVLGFKTPRTRRHTDFAVA
jgi:hypothetical protein